MEQILLGNRYRLKERIGIGGMAYVYEAEDVLLKRNVAVKILKQQFVEDNEFVKKFENEALSVASLSHANIVNVFDVGSEEVDGKSLHYIVMELIEGSTLRDAIQRQGKFSNSAIAKISKQIASALECAHEHNIIHRDIKPANILITKAGDVKVTDFGIARISTTATITYTSSILGTVHYISPEQAKGHFIDQKSDIYSLGVVMYEMATGQVPFDADNSVGIAIKHIQDEPAAPIEKNPSLDKGLNQIILKCMEKDPANRYLSTRELLRDLNNYKDLHDTLLIKGELDQQTEKIKRISAAKSNAVYETKSDMSHNVEKKKSVKWPIFVVLFGILAAFIFVFILSLQNSQKLNNDTVKVPTVIGLPEQEALDLLAGKKLKGEIADRVYDDSLAEGKVTEQGTEQGTIVDIGTTIKLTISKGPNVVEIPDLDGKNEEEATKKLKDLGFKVSPNYKYSDDIEEGYIISSSPSAGETANVGDTIKINISRGQQTQNTKVPTILNMTQSEAVEELGRFDLEIGEIEEEWSNYGVGIVIGQSHSAGDVVPKGTKINIRVSKGKEVTEESESEHESEQLKIKENLHVTPPEGQESFQLTIYDTLQSESVPIYDAHLEASLANESGFIIVQIEVNKNHKLKILINGEEAQMSPIEN